MWAPGIVGLVVGVLLLFGVRDSPEACGYPPIEEVKPSKKKVEEVKTVSDGAVAAEKPSLLELLLTNVLKNPYIWGMALVSFFSSRGRERERARCCRKNFNHNSPHFSLPSLSLALSLFLSSL